MGNRLIRLKLAMIERDGSIRGTGDRIHRNSGKISLGRLYRITEGYTQARPEERTLLCQYLQKGAHELFPEGE